MSIRWCMIDLDYVHLFGVRVSTALTSWVYTLLSKGHGLARVPPSPDTLLCLDQECSSNLKKMMSVVLGQRALRNMSCTMRIELNSKAKTIKPIRPGGTLLVHSGPFQVRLPLTAMHTKSVAGGHWWATENPNNRRRLDPVWKHRCWMLCLGTVP